eukprot:197869-Rhodomonas_salina.2
MASTSEKALALGIVPGCEPSVVQPSLAAVASVQPSLVAYYRLNDMALQCRFGWAIHVWIARHCLVDS